MYLTFLLLRYIINRHLEYVWMGGICSGIEVAITRTIRNRLTVDPVRGFESHPLRQPCVDKKDAGRIPHFGAGFLRQAAGIGGTMNPASGIPERDFLNFCRKFQESIKLRTRSWTPSPSAISLQRLISLGDLSLSTMVSTTLGT